VAEISRDEVEEIALLARLKLTDEEIERLRGELSAILGYVAKLSQLDAGGVEPMTHVAAIACPLRDDVVAPSLAVDEALAAAPARADDFFEVPRIIEVVK
jgi:aspartyl-tRNA(Asn)/glutamyl-tRNA(Gln) amidotransferase subunit C